MKQKIYRNFAIVTAIFMVVVAIMLGFSYYQMQKVSPLQTDVMETLKQMNESQSDNSELQQQIRELDLIARKAYFVQEHQLKTGTMILIGMAVALCICLNLYYKETKNLPEKDMDPIDDWMAKSKARKYIQWGAVGLMLAGVAYLVLSNVSLGSKDGSTPEEELLAEAGGDEAAVAAAGDSIAVEEADSVQTADEASDSLPIPKLTYNAFRGNNSSATSAARNIPTSWDLKAKKNVLWQSDIPKHGYNSPVVNGRNVYITGADNSVRELYCFDVYTGELKWTAKADKISGSPSTMPKVNADTGLAASTVATNGKQVCAIFATGDVLCVDTEGKRLWAKNLGLPDNHYGYASSLLIYGSELIIQYQNNSNAKIMALNVANGNQMWSISPKDKIAWSSPIIATLGGKPALVVMGNPAVAAYNPSNGAELWRVDCMSGEVGSSPASSGGVVFAASEYAKCIAIDGASGETLWEVSDYLPECSSLAATSNLVFCATSYGMVCAYDAKTGEVKKEHDLSTPFYSSPVIVEGKVYLFSNSGKAYVFSASDFSLLNAFETGEKTFATPAFTDEMMIVRTDRSLYCVKKG